MKRIFRMLSFLLVLTLLVSAFPMPAQAAEPESPETGSISATLRIDYDQKLSVLQRRGIRAELLQGSGKSLGSIPLTAEGEVTLGSGSYIAQVGLRDSDGGELLGGEWPAYLDMTVSGLPRGTYTLKFTGDGYRPFSQQLKLEDASQHVTLGTGDATFTLGDLNGSEQLEIADRESLALHLGSTSVTDLLKYDLNGDNRINIIDLAYVTRNVNGSQRQTMGGAEVRSTSLISPVDPQTLSGEFSEAGLVVSGNAEDLLTENGSLVQIGSNKPDSGISIPISLKKPEALREIKITSPDIRTGTVRVEYEDGINEELPFDLSLPANIHAISRDGEYNVVTVELGRRTAVKKIVISVSKNQDGYVTVESVRFLKDIVPETPTVSNNTVKNLSCDAASEKVTLTWDALPNVTGYVVSYYPSDKPAEKKELRVGASPAVISGLDNLKEYTFVVTPTADGWEGRPASVTATPLPNSAPSAPDMVTVTPLDSALKITWKESKNATYYRVYLSKKSSTAGFSPATEKLAGTAATITGLENGAVYSVYLIAGNDIGESGRSRIYEGTPEKIKFERPEGIPTQGVIEHDAIQDVWLAASYNVSPTAYTGAPFQKEFMFDGDFSTHWTSHSYGDGNWWDSKKVFCTFKTPQDISSVIWVPRLDGGYPSNLRVYTVTVWQEGDDLNGPGRVVAPDPDAVTASDVKNWLPVRNNPAVTKFAVLPIEPSQKVVKMAITIEQVGYTAVSLSELMFLEYDPSRCLPENIDALFADTLHTELAGGVTREKIEELRTRLNGEERNYYLNPETMADELVLAEELLSGASQGVLVDGIRSRSGAADNNKYSQSGSELQPLGAAARAGQEITIYAEGIPAGQTLRLKATQYHAEASFWQADVGVLQNGKNIFTIPKIGSQNTSRGGSLYLTYSGTAPEGIRLHVRRAVDIPALELSDWYSLSEEQRRTAIGEYLDELSGYPAKVGVNAVNAQENCLNVTELSLPTILLSLPAQTTLSGVGSTAGSSREEQINTLYNSVLAWEDLMHICKTTQGIDRTYEQNDMTTRQNIRCMQMFTGAFMYAAGSHIGIGYGSCAGMVRGRPISALSEGASANNLYGWGIAHEIGHNMDKLGRAEITNNIYSIMVQTYDGQANTLTSRLEASGKYPGVFTKTAQGYPGASNDVFTQLAMYWQLHLAYDDGLAPMSFYNRFFKAWKSGTYFNGTTTYDDRVALTASAVADRDLTEFFTRWGMVLSQSAKNYLSGFPKEERAIWYLSDESRRERLKGASAGTGTLSAAAQKKAGSDKEVLISIDASGIQGRVQGYEILRNGVSIGFTPEPSYTDLIGSANHKTYEYQVKAYDILGNQIGAPAEAGEIRIAYDAVLPSDSYTAVKNGDTVTFTLKRETAVSGLKITGSYPTAGTYTVTVASEEHPGGVTAGSGSFADNQAVDDGSCFLTYFRKPGAAASDTRIWTYDALTVSVTGIPTDVSASDVQLISYAGDDVSFLEGTFAGRLRDDYVYGDGEEDRIPAGTLVILGNYRGDPVYNGIRLRGRFVTTTINAEGEPETVMEERPLDGYSLLFAEIPADGAVSDISDGLFLFVPNVQKEAELQGATHCDGANLLPAMIRAEIFRTDDPEDTSSQRTTAETLWVNAPGGDELPTVVLEGSN